MTKAEIPDPYYGSEADFEKVYQLIDAACEKVADKLTTNS
jgi:protein tyrosine phosphatase